MGLAPWLSDVSADAIADMYATGLHGQRIAEAVLLSIGKVGIEQPGRMTTSDGPPGLTALNTCPILSP
jgi:hypothetical protein